MKLLILGSGGQLGKALDTICSQEKISFEAPQESDVNICDFSGIKNIIEKSGCTHVMNCAAYNNVDKAEDEQEIAFSVNAIAVRNLAEICQNLKICFTHFSTDYVFDGKKSVLYSEEDIPCPLSVYGKSKLQGEQDAIACCQKSLVIRTSWVFGQGNNFIEKVISWSKNKKLQIADDEYSSPTSAKNLASVALELIKRGRYGLFQVCSHNGCSRYEFAKFILDKLRIKIEVEKVSKNIFNLPAKRPDYSFMSVEKTEKELNKILPCWEEEVDKYLKERKNKDFLNK